MYKKNIFKLKPFKLKPFKHTFKKNWLNLNLRFLVLLYIGL